MDKQAKLGDMRLGAIPSFYEKTVGANPIVEALTLGAAGALVGHHGSKAGLRGIDKALGISSEDTQTSLEGGVFGDVQTVATLFGSAVGMIYAANKHGDFRSGMGGFAKSMTTPGYWDKNPEALRRARQAGYLKGYGILGPKRYERRHYGTGSGRMSQKYGSEKEAFVFGGEFTKETIPVHQSTNIIKEDPYLTWRQKDFTSGIVDSAEGGGGSGLTSGRQVAQSAVHAGVGFGAGYLFGKAMSSIFSLPPAQAKKVSKSGGLAGAIINTGVLEKIL
ncbi:MAG: hypothetical protein ACYTEQ_09300 [Planctomycetota bacterium]|jgi:hypothetical protein